MKHIKTYGQLFESVSAKYPELTKLAKEHDYEKFVSKTDGVNYNILYRGMAEGDELEDNVFMSDWVGHAEQYGEYVDGIVYDNRNEVIYFDNDEFNDFRYDGFEKLMGLDLDDNDDEFKTKLKEIYQPYFDEYKLDDAMYQSDFDEDKVIDFVYDFITNSSEKYEKVSTTKQNDFMVPILMHYAKSKNKNIISFLGGDYRDYGGADEYVVSDISRYTKLSEIWKDANK